MGSTRLEVRPAGEQGRPDPPGLGAASARARGKWTLGPSSSSSGPCEETFRPYRQLAIRVLARALRDMANPLGAATDRESARAFFAGSSMLDHWCRVAALDPRWIADRAGRLTVAEAARLAGDVYHAVSPVK